MLQPDSRQTFPKALRQLRQANFETHCLDRQLIALTGQGWSSWLIELFQTNFSIIVSQVFFLYFGIKHQINKILENIFIFSLQISFSFLLLPLHLSPEKEFNHFKQISKGPDFSYVLWLWIPQIVFSIVPGITLLNTSVVLTASQLSLAIAFTTENQRCYP